MEKNKAKKQRENPRTDYEIARYADWIFSGKVPEKMKEPGCQYYTEDGCKCTTQKTCIGCRFYNPTFAEKLRVLAKDNIEALAARDEAVEKMEAAVEERKNAVGKAKKLEESISLMKLRQELTETCHYSEF